MTAGRAPRAARRIAAIARWLLWPCAFALMLPLLNRLQPASPGTLGWLLDLAAHWQWEYAVVWFALCLLCAMRDRRYLLLAPFAALPLFTATRMLPASDGEGPSLVIVAANVNLANRDPAPLAAWLRAQPADVVMLTELTPAYADALANALVDLYPHRAFAPDDSAFGIGLLSRHPLTRIERRGSVDGIPSLGADIALDGAAVRVVAVHPMPPMAPHWQEERDRLLRMLAGGAAATPMVVAGDLNATPWSTALAGGARGGLFRATGSAPTWPGRHIGIPIDHVLASAHWRRGETVRGPAIGSDHLPVRATLRRAGRFVER
ncbi:endonuclease/exonuclease/phosphatase family protein [Lysobacter hankyongensis]|uniref:Endonuclease/exonuclease/phosphatase domain-containing protein n=1 Tax=Lysobacter hankyongensis TaxID=1176535 RepID=A0ABP9APY3_9GAMM